MENVISLSEERKKRSEVIDDWSDVGEDTHVIMTLNWKFKLKARHFKKVKQRCIRDTLLLCKVMGIKVSYKETKPKGFLEKQSTVTFTFEGEGIFVKKLNNYLKMQK